MNRIDEAYNTICDDWENYRNQTKINPCIKAFVKLLKPQANVLDVGCGTGYPIDTYLSSLGFEVTGIDISARMIEKAKKQNLSHTSFILEDFMNYQTSKTYDAIIAFDSLWHISYQKQQFIYKKISRLLKKDGFLIFTHGKNDGEIVGEMFNVSFYYAALNTLEVHQLLLENGFQIISSIENFQEVITGDRELLIVAKKISDN